MRRIKGTFASNNMNKNRNCNKYTEISCMYRTKEEQCIANANRKSKQKLNIIDRFTEVSRVSETKRN